MGQGNGTDFLYFRKLILHWLIFPFEAHTRRFGVIQISQLFLVTRFKRDRAVVVACFELVAGHQDIRMLVGEKERERERERERRRREREINYKRKDKSVRERKRKREIEREKEREKD